MCGWCHIIILALLNQTVQSDYISVKIPCTHTLVEKKATAMEKLEKLKKGFSFAKLTDQYSVDSTRKRGTDLGFFTWADGKAFRRCSI